MKIITLLLSALLFVPLAASSAPRADLYFYQQLKLSSYRATFNALLKGQSNLEPWVKRYIKDGNGVEHPREMRQVDGKVYELYQICEPHNCYGNFLYLLFEPGGRRAWASLTKDNALVRYFGNPSKEMQAVFEAAAQ